jgi:hypothetical protein
VARLIAADRRALPVKEFAGPDRSYPVNDRSHAVNALSRVSQYGAESLKRQVREKVFRKFPDLAKGD